METQPKNSSFEEVKSGQGGPPTGGAKPMEYTEIYAWGGNKSHIF